MSLKPQPTALIVWAIYGRIPCWPFMDTFAYVHSGGLWGSGKLPMPSYSEATV